MPPKPVPGVARTIKMASIDGQCDTKKGVKIQAVFAINDLALSTVWSWLNVPP